jgi:predicted phosphate transport protein (TIGR00153 family)
MKMWESIFKKPDAFQNLIKEQAQLTVDGVTVLNEFMGIGKEVQNAEVLRHNSRIQIKKVEEEGDKKRRKLINELNKSLITPLDRQDLYNLSNVIDNILDYTLNTIEEMLVYKLFPNYYLKKMIEKLSRGVVHLNYSIDNLFIDKQLANNNVIAAKVIENEIEETYHEALASLFESDDFHYIFKMREVYRHVSNAADRISEAADIIGNILIKEV